MFKKYTYSMTCWVCVNWGCIFINSFRTLRKPHASSLQNVLFPSKSPFWRILLIELGLSKKLKDEKIYKLND